MDCCSCNNKNEIVEPAPAADPPPEPAPAPKEQERGRRQEREREERGALAARWRADRWPRPRVWSPGGTSQRCRRGPRRFPGRESQLSRVLLVRWSRSGRGRRTRTRTASPTPAPTPAPVPVRARSGSNSARRSRCFTGAEAPSTMICYLPELCAVVIVCSWVRRRDVFGRRRSGDVCSGGGRGGGGGGGGGSGG